MLTLYHAPKSRSFRALWLLEELGVPYEMQIVSIRRGDGTGKEEGGAYRRIHPHAKVPAVVHDGVPVFETPAIALYLTDAFPAAGLGPRIGEPTRGPYLTWLSYLTGVFEPAIIAKSIGLPHRHGGFGWAPAEDVEALLVRTLESRSYLLGDTFSAADIAIGGGFPFLMQATLISPLPVFKEYAQRLTTRPAYARAEARDSG